MNLDDIKAFQELDSQNMIAEIDGLPDQLNQAWEFGKSLSLPKWENISRVLIAGMGGSAIGADLLAAYISPLCSVPVVVHRDYNLPAWAKGEATLVIASSHSGNTEETLSAFESAVENGCSLLAISTGGKLAAAAEDAAAGAALGLFEHQGQPRAAVGFSFGLLLATFYHLGLIPDPEAELKDAVAAMKSQQTDLMDDILTMENPAKRLAGQCYGRWVTVMGAGILAPVARRWKGQISELAKAWGQFEFLPEANHNTSAGVINPEEILLKNMVLFLRAKSYHPRNELRANLTKEIFMLEGLGTDFFNAKGDTPLAQLWTTLHFGDYFAYYLAMAYGVDPTPVAAIEGLKERMKDNS
ncbi:MAG: bifunctional phosphoglucose/phosphomannose isomerase [Anaerolineales bacterium]|nr:bifunctional phosphoglucose/phosphomannose isomerase [Anaerolineales bacterium]